MKSKIMPTVVLTVICLVVALILAAVNMLTYPTIQENLIKKENEAKIEILPDADAFSEVNLADVDGIPECVSAAFKADNGAGFVFKVETKGYADGLVLMIGIDAEERISGISVIASGETYGAEDKLVEHYTDKTEQGSSTSVVEGGATLTSNAFNKAIKDSFAAMRLITAEGGNENG